MFMLYFLKDSSIFWKEKRIELSRSYNELYTSKYLKNKGHKNVIDEYTTDVSIAFNNNDGTKTLYVYASPIRFLNSNGQYSIIDTRLANVIDASKREKGYIYMIANSDIKSFYPKEISNTRGILIEKNNSFEFGTLNSDKVLGWYENGRNFIGEEKNMVSYKNLFNSGADLNLYPSSLGTNCEISIEEKLDKSKLEFWFRVSGDNIRVQKEPGGYITMNIYKLDENGNKTSEILAVIQKPLLKDSSGEIYDEIELELFPQGDNLYKLKFESNQQIYRKGTRIFFALEMLRDKQPDNALYSKLPDLEYAYLRNYSVIGNSDKYGIGRLLIRYKLVNLFNLKSSQIKTANYYIYSLTKFDDKLEMRSVLEDWCSLTGNWNKNYKIGKQASIENINRNELKFNITEEVKKWCDDPNGQMEHNGVMLKSITEKKGEKNVILSNDNTLYRNVTEVIFY